MELSDILNREFKITVIKVLFEVRKTMQEQVKISTETENVKRYQTDIIKLKNTITKQKNSTEGFHSRLQQVELRISQLEDRAVKFIELEDQKEETMKKNEDKEFMEHHQAEEYTCLRGLRRRRKGQKIYQRNNN